MSPKTKHKNNKLGNKLNDIKFEVRKDGFVWKFYNGKWTPTGFTKANYDIIIKNTLGL
jgi:hypothetical protein